ASVSSSSSRPHTRLKCDWSSDVCSSDLLPADWETYYGHRPLLLEPLVDASRFRGTCYRAANWIYVGQTTGRGRMDREHKAHGKEIGRASCTERREDREGIALLRTHATDR